MDQTPGFIASGGSHLVCRLRRSLYGLKQSPRAWFGRFSSTLIEFGMTRCEADHFVFFLHSSSGLCTYLVVYVDDIVNTGDDFNDIFRLKSHLQRQFQMKDLGPLKYFLGIEVAQSAFSLFPNRNMHWTFSLRLVWLNATPVTLRWIQTSSFFRSGGAIR